MNDIQPNSNDWAVNSKKNTTRLGFWTLAWVISMAITAFGPRFIWDYSTLPSVIGVLLNLCIGFGMILSNRKYLRGLDELHQKIFLEAGALSLGVGLVCGLSYELLDDIKLISFEPEISHLVILMSLTFLVGMINGQRKYR